jgi:hypothetical protein
MLMHTTYSGALFIFRLVGMCGSNIHLMVFMKDMYTIINEVVDNSKKKQDTCCTPSLGPILR